MKRAFLLFLSWLFFAGLNISLLIADTGPNGGTLFVLGDGFVAIELILDSDDGILYVLPIDGETHDSICLEAEQLKLQITAMSWSVQPAPEVEFPLLLDLTPLQYDWDGDVTIEQSQFEVEHEYLKQATGLEGIIAHIEFGEYEFNDIPIHAVTYAPDVNDQAD